MKKIMVAMVSAASAVFAFGDLPHGADFEANGYVVGESFTNYLNKADDGVSTTGDRYWESSGEEIGNIAEYTGTGPLGVDVVPDYFTNAVSNGKYLQLDSGKTRLLRNIASDGTAVSMSTGDGIYLDTLVKFSAASSLLDSDFESGDKLAIAYVGELDDGNYLSNFVVRAGFIGELLPTNYCAYVPDIATFDVEGWHRLTIRTLTNIDGYNRAGFKIYVDGTNLVYRTDKEGFAAAAGFTDETHTIFPSALAAGQTGADTISAVAFAGNGSIDDVVFTTTKPDFIKEAAVVTVTWDPDEVTAVTLNNTALNAEDVANGSYDIEPNNGVVTFSIVPVSGYVLGPCTVTQDKGDWNGSDAFTNLTAGAVCAIETIYPRCLVNGVNYEDLTLAIEAAENAGSLVTFKLLADCNQVLGFSDGNIILDLNGCDVQGGSDADCSIMNAGATLVITNSGAEASVLLPTNELAEPPMTLLAAAGVTTVQAGTFEGLVVPVEDALTITGGKFLDVDPENPFYLADCVADGLACTKDGDYVVVGSEEPIVGTYTVTVTPTANATYAAAYNDGGAAVEFVNDVAAVTVGKTITITATPGSGYEYAETPTGWTAGQDGKITIEVSAEATVVIPAPTAVSSSELDPATNTPVEIEAESAVAATNAVQLVTPSGVDPAAYKDLFDFTVTEVVAGAKYDVAIAGIKESVEVAVEESAMDVLAGKLGAKVQVPAGLNYKITTYTTLGGSAVNTTSGQSDGTGVSVSKPGDTQGFIKIEMATVPFN